MNPLFVLGRNASRVVRADRSGVLVDGRDYFRAVYEACSRARRSILITGWQFDSEVALLRGPDLPAGVDPLDVELLPFLDRLCRENPDLRVDILAWDFSLVFAFERELLQKLVFEWKSSQNLRFVFDSHCPSTGSHHQKMVVIDGALAFVGGIDLCKHRWDDRDHAAFNPLRADHEVAYPPYHEVHAYVTGPAARCCAEIFAQRWARAGRAPAPQHAPWHGHASHLDGLPTQPTLELGPARLALVRTQASCCETHQCATEIVSLFRDAIGAAERLIYVETQYFTAHALLEALVARVSDRTRRAPEIVVMLPRKPETLKEQLACGYAQAKLLDALGHACRETGTPLGIFNVASRADDGRDVYEYIHAKLLVVDDRFMSVGSANFSNRSMGLDTELNVAWQATSDSEPLAERIRAARIALLEEHVGPQHVRDLHVLDEHPGLVTRLQALADGKSSRLRLHDIGAAEQSALEQLLGEDTIEALDPESPEKVLFPRG
jgi:phosphatidylserine/phosphatidylglycerophosphate/cardiolipin synthase-like enzyme